MKRFINHIFFGLFTASMVADYGCNLPSYEDVSEGKIIYEVSYPGGYEDAYSADSLPCEAILYFKDDKTCIEFITANGKVNTRIISDSNAQTYTALVHAMGQKSAMTLDKDDVKKNYRDHVPLKISFTENTKQIAGVECKEAVCMDSTHNFYSVYYSEDFKIKDPNWCTSFNEINGVLMEYQVQLNNLVINLKAKSISTEKIDPALFIIPPEFKIISSFKNT